MIHTLWSNFKARFGLLVLLAFVVMGAIGPWLTMDPQAMVEIPHSPPSADHLLGTTGQGQDVLAQLMVATRVSLLVGFGVGIVVTLLGMLVGVTAGYLGGWVDDALSLITNLFLVVPGLPLMVVLAAYLPAGPVSIFSVLALTGWAWSARVLRAQTLTLRSRDFIAAAIVAGQGRFTIMAREILPNLTPVIVASFMGATVYAIGAQVGLEFLGLGAPDILTWGTMLYWASNDAALLTGSWWTYVPTGMAIALVGFALAMINFGIDEASNPRLVLPRSFARIARRTGAHSRLVTPVVDARG